MFKTRRQLKKEIKDKEFTINSLKNHISYLEQMCAAVEKSISDPVLDGCVRGPWCQACVHSQSITVRPYYSSGHFSTIYVCARDESCSNFIQRPIITKDKE